MEITAYTLPGCSSCKTLKKLFERAQVQYTEIMVKRDIDAEEFKKSHINVKAFPYVEIDGLPVGGIVDVAKLFVSKGLVSSSK